MNLTQTVRAEIEANLAPLLELWRAATDRDPWEMFTGGLEDFPDIDDSPGTNYAIGYIRGVADGLGVPTADLLDAVDPDWKARCPHGGLATGAGGCPACA